MAWLLVLGLKEGLIECATVCLISWVIIMRMPTTARNLNNAKLHSYLAKTEASRPCTNGFLLQQTFDDRPMISNFISSCCTTPLIPFAHPTRHFYLLHFKFVRAFTLFQSPSINFTHFTNLKR